MALIYIISRIVDSLLSIVIKCSLVALIALSSYSLYRSTLTFNIDHIRQRESTYKGDRENAADLEAFIGISVLDEIEDGYYSSPERLDTIVPTGITGFDSIEFKFPHPDILDPIYPPDTAQTKKPIEDLPDSYWVKIEDRVFYWSCPHTKVNKFNISKLGENGLWVPKANERHCRFIPMLSLSGVLATVYVTDPERSMTYPQILLEGEVYDFTEVVTRCTPNNLTLRQ